MSEVNAATQAAIDAAMADTNARLEQLTNLLMAQAAAPAVTPKASATSKTGRAATARVKSGADMKAAAEAKAAAKRAERDALRAKAVEKAKLVKIDGTTVVKADGSPVTMAAGKPVPKGSLATIVTENVSRPGVKLSAARFTLRSADGTPMHRNTLPREAIAAILKHGPAIIAALDEVDAELALDAEEVDAD